MPSTEFKGAVAIVTGGGSGIGRALSIELAKRGAIVHLCDIDLAAAQRVAKEIGGSAAASHLDVRDAAAFQALVDGVVKGAGKLDLLVNNAGIGVGGEVQDLTVAHWDRVIDVNIRGVVHGVAAAYPGMVQRRSGHILNVASMAGLAPAPLLTPYAMTKHAVVGLSISLRIEAAAYGVKVSALCPAAIETPILDKKNPADLPRVAWMPDAREFLTRASGPPYPVEKLAAEALDGVADDEALIVIPARARLGWRVYRWMPGVVEKAARDLVASARMTKSK